MADKVAPSYKVRKDAWNSKAEIGNVTIKQPAIEQSIPQPPSSQHASLLLDMAFSLLMSQCSPS